MADQFFIRKYTSHSTRRSIVRRDNRPSFVEIRFRIQRITKPTGQVRIQEQMDTIRCLATRLVTYLSVNEVGWPWALFNSCVAAFVILYGMSYVAMVSVSQN